MKYVRPYSPTTTLLRPSNQHTCRNAFLRPAIQYTNHNRQTRTFLINPSPQRITASRTLPYPPSTIYSVIADVNNYSAFLPYCRQSLVTKLSQPAAINGRTYPEEAKLVVGFHESMTEEFWSRVYCVPERVVEAVSGKAETILEGNEVRHHSPRPPVGGGEQDMTRRENVLERLRTRWTLRPLEQDGKGGKEKTEVDLVIEMQFSNPVYAALSQAAVPKVADKMIEAFERRLEDVVNNGGQVR